MGEYFYKWFEGIMENHTTRQRLSRLMAQKGYSGVLEEFELWLERNKVLDVKRIADIKSGEIKIKY